ncbi:(Fe-S)-binding protein [Anaeromicrobium sediminis]|nr:(Fe-S)-binding protein [Anaeromicrobium sediminis]
MEPREDKLKKIKDEYDKCIDCNLCTRECLLLERYGTSPKNILKEMMEGPINEEMVFSCSLCGHCEKVCPKNVDFKKLFLACRTYVQHNKKTFNGVDIHQRLSFSKIFSLERKGKIVFFPGCSLISENPHTLMKTYKYLKEKIPPLEIMIKCCGNPTNCLGKEEEFKKRIGHLEKSFRSNDVEEVVVACQNCYMTIKKNIDIKVTSLWTLLDEIGIPKKERSCENRVFALHDPCPTRYEHEIHESVRNILRKMDVNIEEFKNNRENTLCCGVGGMASIFNRELSLDQMRKRANEVDSKWIVTYCAECVSSLQRGGKEGIHILDLIFNEKVKSKEEKSLMTKWRNRYEFKKHIEEL